MILAGQDEPLHIVCKRGFAISYQVSHWYVEDIIQRLKNGEVNCLKNFNVDPIVCEEMVSSAKLKAFAEQYGIYLSSEQLGSLGLGSDVPSMMCASWMGYYFRLVGDQVPNSDTEIHLEPIPKKLVYEEYVYDMEASGEEVVTLQTFRKIWNKVYPYVKVRKYKTSCGHCNLCSLLGEKRRQFRDRNGRQEVTNLFPLHCLSIMGERRAYYDRRMEAMNNKTLFLSTIADGMQQNHCFLPWFGNQKAPAKHVKQHLQGVLMHGDNITIYRTFGNVGGGANLAIHTWLLSLERYFKKHNELPRTLYHQIDGGPENANQEFLAICALLVASGLVDKVVLTRLPVGHTHEDIDGLFALIWRKLRDEFCLVPSEFVDLIKMALKKKVNVRVVDLLALPDYVNLLAGCFDKSLSRFAKEEWTVNQFIFEFDASRPCQVIKSILLHR